MEPTYLLGSGYRESGSNRLALWRIRGPYRRVRRRVLRDLSARGGPHGSAATHAVGSRLGSARGRRTSARTAGRYEHGVFVGISTHDYSDLQLGPNDRGSIDAHTNTGGAQAIASNRISYCLDCVDPACQSTQRARPRWWRFIKRAPAYAGRILPCACRRRERLLKPEMSIGFSKAGMLASDGRCRAFDASGQGYVRAEGAGIVVLKRLSEALIDGDRIYAVVLVALPIRMAAATA